MRKATILLLFVVLANAAWSQYIPEALSYQAIARDNEGELVSNQEVVVEISILKSSSTGTVEWQEVHYPVTNEVGLFAVSIGKGESTFVGAKASFADIGWTEGSHFVRIRVDFGVSDVLNSLVDMGTVELQSVPYALVAKRALSAPIPALNDLTDVNAATVQTGQVLKWTGTEWQASAAVDETKFLLRDGSQDLTADWTVATNNITLTGGTLSTTKLNLTGSLINGLTTDGTFATVDNTTLASSEAIKTYVDTKTAATGGSTGWEVTATSVYNLDEKIGVGITPGYKFHAEVAGNAFFVQGDTTLTTPDINTGTYMLFLAGKSAFRAGSITDSDLWDDSSVGLFSQAFGKNNRAKNKYSAAFGQNNEVRGNHAVVFGVSNQTMGHRSIIQGSNNTVSAEGAAVFGQNINNGAINSTVIGNTNTASGQNNFVYGDNNKVGNGVYFPLGAMVGGTGNEVLANHSFALGNGNKVEPDAVGSFASGLNSNAYGHYSFVHGSGLFSNNYLHTVLGRFNVIETGTSRDTWIGTEEVFSIGNGIDMFTRSNALTVYQNGNATLAGTLTQASDRRYKKNIKLVDNALARVTKINGVNYLWDTKKLPSASKELQLGVIAQEVEKFFPELVHTKSDGFKTVNYTGLVPVLIEALKEQQKEIEMLKSANTKKDVDLKEITAKYEGMNKRMKVIEELLLKTAQK